MLYPGRLSRPIVSRAPARHDTVPWKVFWLPSNGQLLRYNTHLGVEIYNFLRNTPIFNMKHIKFMNLVYFKDNLFFASSDP